MKVQNKGIELQLLIMIGMVIGVMVAGYFVMPNNEQERQALLSRLGTTNHGDLISPLLPLRQLTLRDGRGESWRHAQQKVKWRMLIPGDAACLDACREMIHTTRQVHLRLGRDAQRFERIYIATEGRLSEEFSDHLKEHPYLKVLYTSAGDWRAWLSRSTIDNTERGIALLVDQSGNAMMHYAADSDGGGMLEDLNHLLKYSSGK